MKIFLISVNAINLFFTNGACATAIAKNSVESKNSFRNAKFWKEKKFQNLRIKFSRLFLKNRREIFQRLAKHKMYFSSVIINIYTFVFYHWTNYVSRMRNQKKFLFSCHLLAQTISSVSTCFRFVFFFTWTFHLIFTFPPPRPSLHLLLSI